MKSFLILFALALGVVGCGSTDTTNSFRTDGSIVGRVVLFDSARIEFDDFSGVRVSIDGTNISTLTDALGRWQLTGLLDDTYDVSATKPGFGTFHWYQQNVNGGRIDEPTAALALMPDYTPSIVSATIDSTRQFLTVWAYVDSTVPGNLSLGCYCDLDSNARPGDAHLAMQGFQNPTGGKIFFQFSRSALFVAGARPGQTVYVSVASYFFQPSFYSTSYHYRFVDPYHDFTERYASNGPRSNVVAIVIPHGFRC